MAPRRRPLGAPCLPPCRFPASRASRLFDAAADATLPNPSGRGRPKSGRAVVPTRGYATQGIGSSRTRDRHGGHGAKTPWPEN